MKIKMIAADSLGVRSMAHLVETSDTLIAMDPGAALAPRRYGLPPHEEEEEALRNAIQEIIYRAVEADLIVITHYHYDHYLRENGAVVYRKKTVIAKHPREDINWSQRKRAFILQKILSEAGANVYYTNGGLFRFGETTVKVSFPVWHGNAGTPLGKLLMVAVEEGGEKYLYASDTQGPMNIDALTWIKTEAPTTIYISGPPHYLAGAKISDALIRIAEQNLGEIARLKVLRRIIIDHHFARKKRYWETLEDYGKNLEILIQDVAGYKGMTRRPLEALRDELWRKK